MPDSSFQKKYYVTQSWLDKGDHTFPKDICPNMNIIADIQFKLSYYDYQVQRFNHYTTWTPLSFILIYALEIYIPLLSTLPNIENILTCLPGIFNKYHWLNVLNFYLWE